MREPANNPGHSVSHVSDTALWVAVHRATESKRKDALFRDPYAELLAGERGRQIAGQLEPGNGAAWSIITRTAVLDELIMDSIRAGAGTILNLAAGLDTRPYRLSLPEATRWIEVDFPEMIAYKESKLADARPQCALERIALDLTDRPARQRLFARVNEESQQVLVITEGLLIYLTPEQVGALADDLHAQPTFHDWLIDIASPWLRKYMAKSWGKTLDAGGSQMHFFPEEGPKFFRPHGWRMVEFRSSLEEAHRLRREMKLAWLWRFMGKISSAERREAQRMISGVVLLERAGTPDR